MHKHTGHYRVCLANKSSTFSALFFVFILLFSIVFLFGAKKGSAIFLTVHPSFEFSLAVFSEESCKSQDLNIKDILNLFWKILSACFLCLLLHDFGCWRNLSFNLFYCSFPLMAYLLRKGVWNKRCVLRKDCLIKQERERRKYLLRRVHPPYHIIACTSEHLIASVNLIHSPVQPPIQKAGVIFD